MCLIGSCNEATLRIYQRYSMIFNFRINLLFSCVAEKFKIPCENYVIWYNVLVRPNLSLSAPTKVFDKLNDIIRKSNDKQKGTKSPQLVLTSINSTKNENRELCLTDQLRLTPDCFHWATWYI